MATWQDVREIANICALDNVRRLKSHAIQSQYSASRKMLEVMNGFQKRIEPKEDIALFYDRIFNIYTAEGVGQDSCGRILAMPRTIEDGGTGTTPDDEY